MSAPLVLASGCSSPTSKSTPEIYSPGGDGNWPMAGANPANSGHIDGIVNEISPVELFTVDSHPGNVSSITAADGIVGATFGGTKLLTWSLDDEAERWRFDAGEGEKLYPAPTFANESLYVRTPGRVLCLSLADGSIRWEAELSSPNLRPVPLDGELVIGAATEQSVVGMNARTGERRWTFETGGSPTGVAIGDERLFVTDRGKDDGRITALDLDTQEVLWQRIVAPIRAPPTVAEGAVLVGDTEGTVRAFSRTDGSTKWETGVIFDAEGVQSRMTVDGEHVYVAPDNDGELTVLKLETGAKQYIEETGRSYWTGILGDTVLFRKQSGVGVWQPESGGSRLVSVPGNISAVCPTSDGVFVAAGDSVYRLN